MIAFGVLLAVVTALAVVAGHIVSRDVRAVVRGERDRSQLPPPPYPGSLSGR